jgi:hypothetical protein
MAVVEDSSVRGTAPAPGDRTVAPGPRGAGLNPFVIAAIAFALGILLAKAVDWRGHAHPRSG